MQKSKAIPTFRKAITKISLMKRKKDELPTEHPDVKMIRRHRAAEAAIKNLEHLKDKGLIDHRSTFMR
ncbi:MAG: hypothetical protein ACW98J_08770 [Candidatus Thorarchaeota archaeon]|jgi:hypothetical protein